MAKTKNRGNIRNGQKAHNKPSYQGAAFTHSNEGANNTTNVQPTTSRKVTPLWVVISKGRVNFGRQLTKDGNVKKACLDAALSAKSQLYPDTERFWLEFRAERDHLTDSKRFCSDCKALGLIPEYVADHVVFEGKSTVAKVLADGLSHTLGEKVRMFNGPLWEDTYSLYAGDCKEAANE
jgi:hypothetical protein